MNSVWWSADGGLGVFSAQLMSIKCVNIYVMYFICSYTSGIQDICGCARRTDYMFGARTAF